MKRAAVYFRNGIGNFLMMTPFLRAMREMGFEIDLVLVSNYNFAERSDAMVEFARSYEGGLLSSVVDVAPDDVADLDGYDQLVAFSHGEDSPMRREFWKRDAAGQGKPIRDWVDHEVLYYLATAYDLGFRGTPGPLELPDSHGAFEFERPFAVFCNGSQGGPLWSRKRWEPKKFGALAWAIHRWTGLDIVLIGGPGELADHAEIAKGRPYVRDLTGQTSIASSGALLLGAELCVSTDTGAMHLAAAAGCPTVALFGPTIQRKNRPWCDPDGSRADELFEIVDLDIGCRPCQYQAKWDSCRDPVCMTGLDVGDVMNAVRRLQRRLGAKEAA